MTPLFFKAIQTRLDVKNQETTFLSLSLHGPLVEEYSQANGSLVMIDLLTSPYSFIFSARARAISSLCGCYPAKKKISTHIFCFMPFFFRKIDLLAAFRVGLKYGMYMKSCF